MAAAAARTWRINALLGLLGLLVSLALAAELVRAWRVARPDARHLLRVFGLSFGYPSANGAALILLAMALLGATALGICLAAAVRELAAARRFARLISQRWPTVRGDVLVIRDPQPLAFCAGLLRPRVYLSDTALQRLSDRALQAVLEHEHHHVLRRDPLRQAIVRVLSRSLFFMPGLKRLAGRTSALAELSADEHAISCPHSSRPAMAEAMLTLTEMPGTDSASGVDPSRVDQLLGNAPRRRLPAYAVASAIAGLTPMLVVAFAVSQTAKATSTLALPVLSRQPCILVLACVPVLLVGIGLGLRGRRRSR